MYAFKMTVDRQQISVKKKKNLLLAHSTISWYQEAIIITRYFAVFMNHTLVIFMSFQKTRVMFNLYLLGCRASNSCGEGRQG